MNILRRLIATVAIAAAFGCVGSAANARESIPVFDQGQTLNCSGYSAVAAVDAVRIGTPYGPAVAKLIAASYWRGYYAGDGEVYDDVQKYTDAQVQVWASVGATVAPLRKGVPVIVPIRIPDDASFDVWNMSRMSVVHPTGKWTNNGHFILAIKSSGGYVTLHNSWGKEWGYRGEVRISERDYVTMVTAGIKWTHAHPYSLR